MKEVAVLIVYYSLAIINCLLVGEVWAAGSDDCVTVKTWKEFKAAVNDNNAVTFCPFSIHKPETERLLVDSVKKVVTCFEAKRCTIRGPGNHVRVRGSLIE